MRKCFWQRWHSQKGRWNALWRLGLRGKSLQVAASRVGAWRMAASVQLQCTLTKGTLNAYGFVIPWELAPPK
jgi:hypothetical protein